MSEQRERRPWWGDYDLAVDENAGWEIGPLRLWLGRRPSEWRVTHTWDDEDESMDWKFSPSAEVPADGVDSERFAVRETTGGVALRPLPADRSVVARPRTPLHVLPGRSARIFLSSPMSVEIAVGSKSVGLREVRTRRLSDTWFGKTTREGELSYALRTTALTNLDEMPRAAYRLLTPVVIENRSPEPLRVERLNLPVPFLSIYSAGEGEAWSEEVHLLYTEAGDIAELEVQGGPPAEAAGAARIGKRRKRAETGYLFRAFGSLLGFE